MLELTHDELCELMIKYTSYDSYSYEDFKKLMKNKYDENNIYFYHIEKAVKSSRYYDNSYNEVFETHNENLNFNNKIKDLYSFINNEFPLILMSKGRMRERYLLGLIESFIEEENDYYSTSDCLVSYISSEEIYEYLLDLEYIQKPNLINKI